MAELSRRKTGRWRTEMKLPLMDRDPQKQAPVAETEELVYADDAVIARAFRWSMLALMLLLAAGMGVWFSMRRKPEPPASKLTVLIAPTRPSETGAEPPRVIFKDITAEAGITFAHCNGAVGDKLLPESMGSGVAFLDYDGDGFPDLLFVNACHWPGNVLPAGQPQPMMGLYHNDGHGHFIEATAGSGLDVAFFGMGVAVGDYDNDGRPDVFISGVGGGRLFHNEGMGKFTEVTGRAGVGGATNDWSTACAWFDYDNDGRLDLFVGNYVQWSKEIDLEVGYKLVGIGRAYGQPFNFEGTFPHLYHNEGGGRFKEVTSEAGLQVRNPATQRPMAKTLGVVPVDLDGDGWMDLIVANDTVQNWVFHNERNGAFKEIGALTGIAYDSNGTARGAMGIDVARYREDGALGVAIGNFANEMTALYVSDQNPLRFVDEAIAEGVGPASRLYLKFGLFFFDYDLDGRLDLLTANGHLEEDIGKIQVSQTYAQPAQLFWNRGLKNGATFCVASRDHCGPDLFRPIVGRGAAYADIDGDGDLDVVLTQTGGPPLLLRNDQQSGHHWLRLKLLGKTCNRDAIGAWVTVRSEGRVLARQVMPTKSYLSQSELPVNIGLGSARRIEDLEIVWPGGQRQNVTNARLDALTVIEQEPVSK
jgi:enediyne biosynthesis protein E4